MADRRCATTSRLRIVVAATIASAPGHGGWTWAVLQYVLGLRRLGHRVLLVDPVQPGTMRPAGAPWSESSNAAYCNAVLRQFDLEDAAAVLLEGSPPSTIGKTYDEVLRAVADADLLINVSGVLRDPAVLERATRRVYLDLDPGFTQLWQEAQHIDMGFDDHTDFVTIGLAIGQPGCPVPTCGRHWITTVQPVVLEHWPVAPARPDGPWTTVANWRGYGSVEHGGVFYGQKAHAFRGLISLPRLTVERLLIALAIHPEETADLAALAAHGWTLVDPAHAACSPDRYQAFVQQSKAELGVAKTGYVRARCGWFSDRSVCYLASGRPVIAQDTGLAPFVPTGEGLIEFSSTDEAASAIERVRCDYGRHSAAARDLAEECFDANKVLPRLLEHLAVPA